MTMTEPGALCAAIPGIAGKTYGRGLPAMLREIKKMRFCPGMRWER
jgi:hypothetical protein